MNQRRLGYVTTFCRGCQGYRKHALWKLPGRRGKYVLTCNLCACERGLEDDPTDELIRAQEHARRRAPRRRRDCRVTQQPTAEERAALDAYPMPRGGDAEDHGAALVAYFRERGIEASASIQRGDDGNVQLLVRLPSGACIYPLAFREAAHG